jgi:integrase
VKNVAKRLHTLNEHADLDKPETVKGYIARLDRQDGYKRTLTYAYNTYVKHHGLTWNKPKYYQASKLPKIPQESKIDMIRANAPLKLAVAITISKETGLRPIEVMHLRLRDIDLDNKTIYPSTAKHGAPRALTVTTDTIQLLKAYLAKHHITLNNTIFGKWNSPAYSKWFRHYRNKLVEKLNDTTIKTIRLYDLRHFFATKLYHQTKDILYVKQQLGHRKLDTTLIYTQLIHFHDDEYTTAVADTINKARELLENGFEYVTDMDNLKIFRKRK